MKTQIRPVTARQTVLRLVRKTVRFKASHYLITGVAAFLWCGIQSADAESFRPIASGVNSSILMEHSVIRLDRSPIKIGGAMILGTGDVATIPEPGAIAMLLGGFGTLLGFQRLRRRH